jgi:NMD protein affecting ribosome stability and mRNA decay
MADKQPIKLHQHVTQQVHVLRQRAGVPYEVEQKVCADCRRVLDETPVRRAAA